jgi:hypothetical protein
MRREGLKAKCNEVDVEQDEGSVQSYQRKEDIQYSNDDRRQSCASGRAMKGKDKGVLENITSGQSGDCLVYSWGFIYIWGCAQTMVCARSYHDVIGKSTNGIYPSEATRMSYS